MLPQKYSIFSSDRILLQAIFQASVINNIVWVRRFAVKGSSNNLMYANTRYK